MVENHMNALRTEAGRSNSGITGSKVLVYGKNRNVLGIALSLFFLTGLGLVNTACSQVREFRLVDATDGHTLTRLKNGSKIDIDTLPAGGATIRALNRHVGGSIAFYVNSTRPTKIENFPPYLLTELGSRASRPFALGLGTHTVKASAFGGSNARGSFLAPSAEISINVFSSKSAAKKTPVSTEPKNQPEQNAPPSQISSPTPKPNFEVGPSSVENAPPSVAPAVASEPLSGPIAVAVNQWVERASSFATIHCKTIKSGSGFNSVYYDSQYVFYKIAELTGESKWRDCAEKAEAEYRDRYVLAKSGLVYGHENFTDGLLASYQLTGDSQSREAVLLLAQNAYFARDITADVSTIDPIAAREVGYAIVSYLDAETLGAARRDRLGKLVQHGLGHIDKWRQGEANYKPFMAGILARGLIRYAEKVDQAQVIPGLEQLADFLWDNAWDANSRSFVFSSDDRSPAPDLNLLIAPLYEWLYQKTGTARFRERGDQIFIGGVENAWLYNIKAFHQNYMWSFDYVQMRKS
jgi:hypothetical protein